MDLFLGRFHKQWQLFLLCLITLLLPSISLGQTVLHVGYTDNKPAVFTDSGGRPQGIYVDVLDYIAHKEGWQIEYQRAMWNENLRKLQAGELDLLLDVAASPEREAAMSFSAVPLVEDWARVFVAPKLLVSDFADLEGMRVGLVRDDIHTGVFLQIIRLLGVEPIVVLTESSEMSMEFLNRGRIDALVLPNLQSKVVTHEVTCVRTDLIFNPVELRFAAPKGGQADILERIDYHVTILKARPTSVYHKSMTKWVEGVQRVVLPRWLSPVWGVAGVAGLILVVFSFNILLRRQVRIQTKALKQSIAVQQRQESELAVARDIQLGLLPAHSFAMGDYEMSAYLQPAKMVGGDFFDFFPLSGHRLCFLIADVADKGVPAALFMAATKTCLTVMAKEFQGVDRLLDAVNGVISENNPRCMFVTMFCAVLDLETGMLNYTLAGHDPPYLQRQSGELSILNQAHCMALGLDEDAEYEQATIQISAGDTLFMFTDGVTEAMNTKGEQFGEEALLAVLHQSRGGTSVEVQEAMQVAVEHHVGSTPPHDDITMFCLRRKP